MLINWSIIFSFVLFCYIEAVHSLSLPSSSSFSLTSISSLFHSKKTYKNNEPVDLIVNTVSSKLSNIPYSYYNLPFICPPTHNVKPVFMSLSEILNGDNFMQSDYFLNFKTDEPCLSLCDRIMKHKNIKKSYDLIKGEYIAEWRIDGLPGSTTFISDSLTGENKKYYIPGFPLGYMDGEDAYINNHLMLVIRYNKEERKDKDDDDKYTIVGFEVYPKSVDDSICPGASKSYKHAKLDLTAENQLIHFTYSVYWREESQINYNDRWNYYLDPSSIDSNGNFIKSNNKSIHWISLINSFVMITFVSIIFGFIFLITFKKDLNSTNPFIQIANNSFNKPVWADFLAILTGSGIQLIFTLLTTGLLTLIFIQNAFGHETTTLSATISILIIGGFFAGFSSIQMIKLFQLTSSSGPVKLSYRKTLIISSLSGSLIISICLFTIHIGNLFIFDKDSPRALKFSTFMTLLIIYTLLQIPISAIGGVISKNINVFTNLLSNKMLKQSLPSQTPTTTSIATPIYLKFPLSLVIIGFFPCCIVFIESRFAYISFLSIRNSTSSFVLGFLILTAILLGIIMVEIGVVATYLRLNKSNSVHNWQWWTFLNCTLSIWIYLMFTSLYQLTFKLNIKNSGSPVLYIIYTTILNSLIAISCGSLALWSAICFIYATVLSSTLKSD